MLSWYDVRIDALVYITFTSTFINQVSREGSIATESNYEVRGL
jgi:hypothetical protein